MPKDTFHTGPELLQKFETKTLERKIEVLEKALEYTILRGGFDREYVLGRAMGYDQILTGDDIYLYKYFGT